MAAHGLEALSAAASRDQYSFISQAPPADHVMMPSPIHYMPHDSRAGLQSPPTRHAMLPPGSPSTSINSTNNNINFLLNPTNSMSPVIDPSLQSPMDHRDSSVTVSPLVSQKSKQDSNSKSDQPVESDHEVAFLLRHFAEAPGQW